MFKHAFAIFLLFTPTYAYASDEIPVEIIPLAAPLNQAKAEISGLAWCQDKLILLPQYPKRISNNDNSYFYYLERQEILDHINGVTTSALHPKRILINEKQLRKAVTFFDGFEAIACNENKIWLSIEALNVLGTYQSFVVPGVISFTETPNIEIDQTSLVQLKTQSNMRNIGDEAILFSDDNVMALHEVNDAKAVSAPKARLVNRISKEISALNFPHLPYRITDATTLDGDKRFWVINYKYSGDKFSRDTVDPLADEYGQGASHKKYDNVERLVELQLRNGSISLITQAPIQLEMNANEGRNWEGLVRLEGKGFLLATDKHPSTLLGFVPYTNTSN